MDNINQSNYLRDHVFPIIMIIVDIETEHQLKFKTIFNDNEIKYKSRCFYILDFFYTTVRNRRHTSF